MAFYLGPKHEVQGEDDHRRKYELGRYVSLPPETGGREQELIIFSLFSAGICGSIRTVEILGLSTNNYTSKRHTTCFLSSLSLSLSSFRFPLFFEEQAKHFYFDN